MNIRPRPQVGETWRYKKTGTKYQVTAVGVMKQGDGVWTNSVTYRPVNVFEEMYTRDLDTFLEKFERAA